MALQTITDINVDFYDKKYILINAKRLDKNSRFLLVTCYNQGKKYPIDKGEHSAYIRYKKSDDNSVFNFCEITDEGKVLVELTEQMLVSEGICYADLVIVNRGDAKVDTETGEIVAIDNASILSTMTFCIDVSETAIENTEVESSYEYDGLNIALERAEAEYKKVSQLSRSYAIGNAGKIRADEDTNNSKYYCEQSLNNLIEANSSKNSAEESAEQAETYMGNAKKYMDAAHADAIKINNKLDELVDAFLPMGTITYAELQTLKANGDIRAGYLYNISDNFVTDDSFRAGAGIEYGAGTNVYYTATGYFDCLIGTSVAGVKGDKETSYRLGNVNLTAENIGALSSADIASTDEVKSYLGI